MAFKDFASVQYVKTFETGEEPRIGNFRVATSGELQYMRVKPYIFGTLAGTEKIRVNIYGDSLYTGLLYQSSWSNLYDVLDENGNAVTGNWLGWIRVDFNRENLNKDITYYATIELTGYTRNAEVFYIGACFDFPFPVFDNGEPLYYDHPLAFELFQYVARQS